MRVRKQQDRSVHTREKLIAATLDQIFEVGFHATTTQDIAERVGVSRGALLYHFPARQDIILASMEELLLEAENQIMRSTNQFQEGTLTISRFVDMIWIYFSNRFFFISLEMITEARSDPHLRERMLPVVKKFHDALDSMWEATLRSSCKESSEKTRAILNLTLCVLRGMGLQTVLKSEPNYYRNLLLIWKSVASEILETEKINPPEQMILE